MSGAARWSLLRAGGEAVLVELAGGRFYRLNQSAALALAELEAGRGPAGAARKLADELGAAPAQAAADVAALLATIDAEAGVEAAPPRPSRNAVSFSAERGGWTLSWDGEPLVWLAADGRGVAAARPLDGAAAAQALRTAAPHLLALRGRPLLHAAAIARGGGLLALSGGSGAGKSTLAAAFVAAGAAAVSGDLLAVAVDGAVLLVFVDAEAAIHGWAAAHAAVLAAAPIGGAIDASALDAAYAGPTVALAELWFLVGRDAGARELAVEASSGADAMLLLLENAFAEVPDARVWSGAAELAEAVARGVQVRRARVPEGLDLLIECARRFL